MGRRIALILVGIGTLGIGVVWLTLSYYGPTQPSKLPQTGGPLGGLSMSKDVSAAEISQIIAARGGKDPQDQWVVDRLGEYIRIRKSRTDGSVYPPGAAVEFWRQDASKKWRASPTA